jgi:6-pyruvoyl-tetrahydropterin synthase
MKYILNYDTFVDNTVINEMLGENESYDPAKEYLKKYYYDFLYKHLAKWKHLSKDEKGKSSNINDLTNEAALLTVANTQVDIPVFEKASTDETYIGAPEDFDGLELFEDEGIAKDAEKQIIVGTTIEAINQLKLASEGLKKSQLNEIEKEEILSQINQAKYVYKEIIKTLKINQEEQGFLTSKVEEVL